MIKVTRIAVEPVVTIEMSGDVAQILYFILDRIGGEPYNDNPRAKIDELREAMYNAGVRSATDIYAKGPAVSIALYKSRP